MSRLAADLLLLAAALIWGLGFIAQSTAMDDVGPLTFTGLRFSLAALAVWPLARLVEKRKRAAMAAADMRACVLIGVVFFAAAALQQWGLVSTSVTNAGFLTATYVVMVPFAVWALYRKPPPFIVWPAAMVSVAGTFLLGGGGIAPLGVGDLLVICGAVFWALHVTFIGLVAMRSGRPLHLAAIQFAVCGICGLAAGIPLERPALAALVEAAPEIIYASLVAGALGFTFQAVAQRYTPPADAAIILSGEGVFAAIFAAWLLGDRMQMAGAIGAGLILAAILAVELAPLARRARRTRKTIS